METLTTQQNEDSFPLTWMNQLSDWIIDRDISRSVEPIGPDESDAGERVSDLDRISLLVEVVWIYTQLKKSLLANKNTL